MPHRFPIPIALRHKQLSTTIFSACLAHGGLRQNISVAKQPFFPRVYKREEEVVGAQERV